MGHRWRREQPSFEQAGPYQFYPTNRPCPACGESLLSQERLSFGPSANIIRLLGMPCYCMACNGRFRASPKPWMRYLPWILGTILLAAASCAMLAAMRWAPLGGMRIIGAVATALATGLAFSQIPYWSRWLWWRLVRIKKIFTYEEGGLL